jgi:hypothetical protein
MADDVHAFPARYPLSAELPRDIADRSHTWFTSYRRYPVFSAPWFWRRTALFGSVVCVIGLLQAALVSRLIDRQAATVLWICSPLIWLGIVTAGPAFATIVRHRELSPKRERIGLVIAIAAGLAVSFGLQQVANELSRELVYERAKKAGTISIPTTPTTVGPVAITFMYGWQLLLFSVLGGGVALRTYFKEPAGWRAIQQERRIASLLQQKSEVDLKLAVLQAQVEPHFLFNTLASVHSLIRSDPGRAEATIEALVDHLRATLPKLRAGVGSPHSTLATQLEVCRSYLEVMLVRMGSRLRYEIDVPAALHEHPFPPFMLISLVENAVKHGIEPSAAGGWIRIRARIVRKDDAPSAPPALEVTVQDDGVGLRPGLSDGVGLVNLRAQLAAQFGAQGRFTIGSGTGGGVDATISVPYVEATT